MGERTDDRSFRTISSRDNLSSSFLQQLTLVTQKTVYATGEHQGTHRTKEGESSWWGGREHKLYQHHLSPWISVWLKPGTATQRLRGWHSPLSVYIHFNCGSVSYHLGSKGHHSRLIFLIFQRGSSRLWGGLIIQSLPVWLRQASTVLSLDKCK